MVQAHKELKPSTAAQLMKERWPSAHEGFGAFSELKKDHEPEVRISWRTDSLMARVHGAHNFLLFKHRTHYGNAAFEDLMADLAENLHKIGFYGAPTKGFRKCYAAIEVTWKDTLLPGSPSSEEDIHLEAAEHLITLARVADLFDERDPREVPFVRHMEKFLSLIMYFPPEGYWLTDSYVTNNSRLRPKRRAVKLFRDILVEREKLFFEFNQKRLDTYFSKFRLLGRELDFENNVVAGLEDELLIELEWFHYD